MRRAKASIDDEKYIMMLMMMIIMIMMIMYYDECDGRLGDCVTGMKKSFFKIIACTSIHNKPQLKRQTNNKSRLKRVEKEKERERRVEGSRGKRRRGTSTNDDNCAHHISRLCFFFYF